eukprot:TRINITY_DN13175_c0_g1_i1.p1 TRINITY_DN13175_c0_g1~~TRINITY_DN13175_c0_g1_i1.p1  ORF type:complete len:211 (+),score=29.34 TRINITY_DN13175_c0_g1_i1:231-863(+)
MVVGLILALALTLALVMGLYTAVQWFKRPPRLSSLERHQVLARYFHAAVDVFESAGVEFWIDWGTLLGWWREGRILLHDWDVDLGFHAKDADLVRDAMSRIIQPPLQWLETTHRNLGPKFKILGMGLHCDLYSYAEEHQDLLRCCIRPESLGTLERRPVETELMLPLTPAKMMDRLVYVPRQPKTYLNHRFGFLGWPAVKDKLTGHWAPA